MFSSTALTALAITFGLFSLTHIVTTPSASPIYARCRAIQKVQSTLFVAKSYKSDQQNYGDSTDADSLTAENLLSPELVRWIDQHPNHAELKLLAPGLVYVRIHGGKRTFDSIGIKNISDANGEKDLHFLTACGATYGLHVIGNEKLFEADNIDSLSSPFGAVLEEKLTASVNIRAAVATAYINGGFYNRFNLKFPNSTADKGKAEHATIGFARTLDGIVLPFIDPPAKYLDKYETVNLTGQSVVTGAPAIARNGDPAFTDADMVEDRYKYNPDNITPGLLNHAEHPNPRSAIIVPTSPGRNANYLLLAAFSTSDKRGAEATGFTMVEWARVASRLARLDDRNGQPMNSIALNLDGGASTVMGADLGGLKLLDVRQHKETRTPYLVAMVPINKV